MNIQLEESSKKMPVLNSGSHLTASKKGSIVQLEKSWEDLHPRKVWQTANDPVAIARRKLGRKVKSKGEQWLAKIFNNLDSDASGTLSIQEFEKLLDALLGRKLAKTPGVAGRVWGSLGTNGHELDQATLIGGSTAKKPLIVILSGLGAAQQRTFYLYQCDLSQR